MKKILLEEAERVPIDRDGRILYRAEKNELIHITLNPGQSIPLHPNAVDVIFFIVEGSATLTNDTETSLLNPSDTIFIEKDTNRGLANNTDKIVRVLVFKMK
jgi:quercetin dioxygenase-like cupin family protein